MDRKIAIIIGAGPAGLTAAYELLNKTEIKPVIYEATDYIGGISRTVNYKGNRIDIGGHRFFSKSNIVMQWWLNTFPLQGAPAKDDILLGRHIPVSEKIDAPDPEKEDNVMLIRRRISRIFFLRKFFDYPLSLNFATLSKLGLTRVFKITLSYIMARMFPIKEEKNLEDFFINRFGRELYLTFFKNYTKKVWGTSCKRISAEWGAQRVKGLSIAKAIAHAVKKIIFFEEASITQKKTETSLIEQFMYPKFGPGQFWEYVADIIKRKGGEIHLKHEVVGIDYGDRKITEIKIRDKAIGTIFDAKGDCFFSSMPIKDLIKGMGRGVPQDVREVAEELLYRDFITVGLLLKKLKIENDTNIKTVNNIIPDNWIYMQERDVKLGRIQIFNNWSPYMVKDQNTIWIGLEYFCNEGDSLWSKPDKKIIAFAIDELVKLNFIEKENVLDGTIIRMKKTYPAYCGGYERFRKIRDFTDNFENLFLIGRNGMHRYNNTDHSMLTAIVAVKNIINNIKTKDNVWAVNTEQDYHEAK